VNPSTLSDTKTETSESRPTSAESLVRSLRKLLDGDEQEQQATFEYLKNALEEDRQSTRRLFDE
jgi:hypothetical protein